MEKKLKSGRIRSMTGFGRGAVESPYGKITAEIKTLNNKSLSISCSPFESFFLLEERIGETVGSRVKRGKVIIKVAREKASQKKYLEKILINNALARDYAAKINKLGGKLSLKGELRIQDVLGLPGVVEQVSDDKEEKVWPYIRKAVEIALKELVKYREKEGAKLAKDLLSRVEKIKKALGEIKKYEKKSIENYRSRLDGMLKSTLGENKVDKSRLEEEVALFARNCDIAEETVRLKNHAEACAEALKGAPGEAGQKLDFIAQEMHRETNTIGAKSEDYRISNAVIEIKSEIEKIREQLKNIE